MRQTTRDFQLLAFAKRRGPLCVPSEEWTRIIVDRFDRFFSFVPPFVRSSNTRYIGSFARNENLVSARVNLSSSLALSCAFVSLLLVAKFYMLRVPS